MREGIRTVILFALLIFSIGFIFWMQSGVNSNFVDQIDIEPEEQEPTEDQPASE